MNHVTLISSCFTKQDSNEEVSYRDTEPKSLRGFVMNYVQREGRQLESLCLKET